MISAQGEVQEKGYVASFPALVNIAGEPTYIMVLKDDGGLVRLYALVNVKNYRIVVTAENQKDAIEAYRKQLREEGITEGGDQESDDTVICDIIVSDVRLAYIDGETVVYITSEDGIVHKGYLNIDESLILIRKGDKIRLTCIPTEISEIFSIRSWSKTDG